MRKLRGLEKTEQSWNPVSAYLNMFQDSFMAVKYFGVCLEYVWPKKPKKPLKINRFS